MAYQNLALRNIAGEISVTYNDNNMRSGLVPDPQSGPRLVLTGTAKTGAGAELFRVDNTELALLEYHVKSELASAISAAKDTNPTVPLTTARVGAKPFHFILEREITGSKEKETVLVVTPRFVQEEDSEEKLRSTLQTYKLILLPHVEGNLVRQRVLIAAANQQETIHTIVYDSERLLQINGDSAFDVDINVELGEVYVTPAAFDIDTYDHTLDGLRSVSHLKSFDYTGLLKLSDSENDHFNAIELVLIEDEKTKINVNTHYTYSIEQIEGFAGDYIDHVERYASNEDVYQKLEFENFSYMYCEKCFADVGAVDLKESMSLYRQSNWHKEYLGYYWKLIFNGLPRSFFFASPNPFDSSRVDTYTHDAITYTLEAGHQALGDLLNLVTFYFHHDAAGAKSVESFFNRKGRIECHITCDINNEDSVKTPFANLSGIVVAAPASGESRELRPSLVETSRTLSDAILDGTAKVDLDPFIMTPFDLVGELVPESVMSRLLTFQEQLDGDTDSVATLAASNKQVREVSFLHQAAQAAYVASTNYNQVICIVPTTAPEAGEKSIPKWAGNPAKYQVTASGDLVVTEAGSGVLGTKLLAGHPDYRNGMAFGGVILTNGAELPNEQPYGIDDTDEALDAMGNPIDLGKHCVVVGAYGFVNDPQFTSRQNRKTAFKIQQRGAKFQNGGPQIAAKLNNLLPGQEPIGPILGRVPGFSPQQRTPRAVLNDLAALRICMIDQTGVISSIYTAASRTSDYTKISSIMSANVIVSRIRRTCLPLIGRAYDDNMIASLNAALDGLGRSLSKERYAQEPPVIRLSASRLDRINGVLRVSVRFIPPLSLEAIEISLTLDAPNAI